MSTIVWKQPLMHAVCFCVLLQMVGNVQGSDTVSVFTGLDPSFLKEVIIKVNMEMEYLRHGLHDSNGATSSNFSPQAGEREGYILMPQDW